MVLMLCHATVTANVTDGPNPRGLRVILVRCSCTERHKRVVTTDLNVAGTARLDLVANNRGKSRSTDTQWMQRSWTSNNSLTRPRPSVLDSIDSNAQTDEQEADEVDGIQTGGLGAHAHTNAIDRSALTCARSASLDSRLRSRRAPCSRCGTNSGWLANSLRSAGCQRASTVLVATASPPLLEHSASSVLRQQEERRSYSSWVAIRPQLE